jgi:hypothetical protein
MCILKLFNPKKSFKTFCETTKLPIYSVYDIGEKRTKSELYTIYTLSLDVSDRDFDEFSGQVTDAISFLKKFETELIALFDQYQPTDKYLDFPIYSRLNSTIVNQNDHLPSELIKLAGKLELGIEMAIYSPDFLD